MAFTEANTGYTPAQLGELNAELVEQLLAEPEAASERREEITKDFQDAVARR